MAARARRLGRGPRVSKTAPPARWTWRRRWGVSSSATGRRGRTPRAWPLRPRVRDGPGWARPRLPGAPARASLGRACCGRERCRPGGKDGGVRRRVRCDVASRVSCRGSIREVAPARPLPARTASLRGAGASVRSGLVPVPGPTWSEGQPAALGEAGGRLHGRPAGGSLVRLLSLSRRGDLLTSSRGSRGVLEPRPSGTSPATGRLLGAVAPSVASSDTPGALRWRFRRSAAPRPRGRRRPILMLGARGGPCPAGYGGRCPGPHLGSSSALARGRTAGVPRPAPFRMPLLAVQRPLSRPGRAEGPPPVGSTVERREGRVPLGRSCRRAGCHCAEEGRCCLASFRPAGGGQRWAAARLL